MPAGAATQPPAGWRPRGGVSWTLCLVAGLFAVFALLAAYGVLAAPQLYNIVGAIGFFSLMFPLHLLILAVLSIAVALFARRRHARLALALSGAAALIIAALGAWPAAAQWRLARSAGASLSFTDYWTQSLDVLDREKPPVTERYGTTKDGTQLMLDIWPASGTKGRGPRPALIFIHGGGWVEGKRSRMQTWDRWANALGYHVFNISYRLAPPARWREEVADVKCAAGWINENAKRLDVDPSRIVLLGSSAGGNLATLAAYSMDDAALPASCDVAPVKIKAVVNLYGPVDLVRLHAETATKDRITSSIEQYIGGSPEQFLERYRAVSPLSYIDRSSTPTISFIGLRDRLVPHNQIAMLDAALGRHGVVHESWFLPGADHVYDANWGAFSTQFTRERAALFLKKVNPEPEE